MLKTNKKRLHYLEKCGNIDLSVFPSLALGGKIKWQEENTMKRRILSLTLALLMALSVMAFPAAAYEDAKGDTQIETRGITVECPNCLISMSRETRPYGNIIQERFVCRQCGHKTSWNNV